jgi:hypothetical protein
MAAWVLLLGKPGDRGVYAPSLPQLQFVSACNKSTQHPLPYTPLQGRIRPEPARIVFAQQRGPESSSLLGPRPSIDGLVVCALRLALTGGASSLLCGAPYVPDGDASVGAGALYL